MMLRMTLDGEGYETAEAPNGKVAVELHREWPADLVITDVVMPEQEGIATVIELRRDWPTLPIIVISGGGRVDSQNYLRIAEGLGANRTFAKPVDRGELLHAVRELL
ncbi:MAG: response regulator, partial [Candidatus Latescibacterota bacterium]